MRVLPHEVGTLHFVGIGGIGMSGIAEILHDLGYRVQGSDLNDGPNVQRLRAKGIRVLLGHDRMNIYEEDGTLASVVVISSAVKDGNAELDAARSSRVPVVRRAEMLAELLRLKHSVVIGGTHGKTTTTSMVGAMLEEGSTSNPKMDPTVINGGIVNRYGTNVRLGKGDWMVAEADESDGTFTRLPATVAIVTNIDPEHMEQYGSFDNVRKAYTRFVQNLPFYGYAVLCTDHPEVQALIPQLSDRRLITYGFNAQADVRASNLRFENGGCRFDVTFAGWIKKSNDQLLRDIFLPMPGRHNVQNAVAALAVGFEMGMDFAALKSALAGFGGVKRRFTKTGEVGGVSIIDDYGHHPVEIAAVLKAARESIGPDSGRVIAVMQPHRYSRLADLFEEFCTCFNDADTVLVSDVYPAGEPPIEGAGRDDLVAGVIKHGHRDVRELASPDALPEVIAEIAQPGDLVLCLGAGDITKWAHALPEQLEALAGGTKQIA